MGAKLTYVVIHPCFWKVLANRSRRLVADYLFGLRYDTTTGTVPNPVVTSDDLVGAIDYCSNNLGTKLSTKNRAITTQSL